MFHRFLLIVVAIRKKDVKDRAFHIDDYSSLSSGTATYITDELVARRYIYLRDYSSHANFMMVLGKQMTQLLL